VTFHAWAQNWGWYSGSGPVDSALSMAESYITGNIPENKPCVLEEFGLARDGNSYTPGSPTTAKDSYYEGIFDFVYKKA
jgi:mannan endo-1,4-beta-mannosidase